MSNNGWGMHDCLWDFDADLVDMLFQGFVTEVIL